MPPFTPSVLMMLRMTSLAKHPLPREPVTVILLTFGFWMARHCVASTSRTWLVPMPKATVPNAPWVLVWLSPHAMVMPGCVSPSSGPMTCTMPCFPEEGSKKRMPDPRRLCSSAEIMPSASTSMNGLFRVCVGRMWSTVANVLSGYATVRLRSRSMLKAWGVVTSWMRCSPMKSWVRPSGSSFTVCSFQTLLNRFSFPIAFPGCVLGSKAAYEGMGDALAPLGALVTVSYCDAASSPGLPRVGECD